MIELCIKPKPKNYSVTLRPHFKSEAMIHLGEIAVLILASLWLVEGQPGTVRTAEYDVLRNNSGQYNLNYGLLVRPPDDSLEVFYFTAGFFDI